MFLEERNLATRLAECATMAGSGQMNSTVSTHSYITAAGKQEHASVWRRALGILSRTDHKAWNKPNQNKHKNVDCEYTSHNAWSTTKKYKFQTNEPSFRPV